ncbi:MAG: hypothetical protein C5B56_01995 [Proteobacteria bacterium]|nr:MAG: hypothetical protein C5B56_01995 [Pseudomonadota bacterium]
MAAGRGPWIYLLVSAALLAPCYWQPRLQAGDLSSHIYNAWLAQLIESGRADGLALAPQTTNILFDLMLGGLFRLWGPDGAQRIAVSVAVLVFVWGAFAFVSRVAGSRAWHLLPCIAMLGYGWVFHMGFFNFYISMGLCCWALSLMWEATPRRIALAAPLLLLAYAAHALPVAWACALAAYAAVSRRLTPLHRGVLAAASVAGLALAHVLIGRLLPVRWSPLQWSMATGLDQVWVFDAKYFLVVIGLLAAWGLVFLVLLRHAGARQVIASVPFQICLIGAAAVFGLPSTIQIPGFLHALSYITERMSLGVAVSVCALLATAPARTFERYALAIVAIVFFVFLYRDDRTLNAFEDRMQDVVAMLPPGERVISPLIDTSSRINTVGHMIDRVCVGRCFSYANYEPSTAQFRVRAVRRNPLVIARYADSLTLQTGGYVVKDSDPPLYRIDLDREGRIFLRSLKAGARSDSTDWRPNT